MAATIVSGSGGVRPLKLDVEEFKPASNPLHTLLISGGMDSDSVTDCGDGNALLLLASATSSCTISQNSAVIIEGVMIAANFDAACMMGLGIWGQCFDFSLDI